MGRVCSGLISNRHFALSKSTTLLLHWWRPADGYREEYHDHPRWSVTICLRGKIIERTPLTDEQREFIDNYAMRIFADCVNVGNTFQAAIAAVYLSGLQNGIAIHEAH